MSNDYRWLTFSISSNRKCVLTDSDFDILAFPEMVLE